MNSDHNKNFLKLVSQVSLVYVPKFRIATFGDTEMDYFFLSQHVDDSSKTSLRRGKIVVFRPKLIIPDGNILSQFEGFDDDKKKQFEEFFSAQLDDNLKILEYGFRHKMTSVETKELNLDMCAKDIKDKIVDADLDRSVILTGPDSMWQVALMKFIISATQLSVESNMNDFEEHGFFSSGTQILEQNRCIIESLFSRVTHDPSLISVLAKRLKDFGLFSEYQDRFFKLLSKR